MVVHRDHGWSDGWGDPFFTTTEVDALTNTNDNLPVVLSINCASARYDDDETSFVQNALVKPTGGAVGAFGDTRNSPSWHNSQIALGFIDALLPSVLAGEGPATKQRVGDALTHGKLRLAGLAPPSGPGIAGGDGNTRNELYLWHYFGDPTMQMFGGGSPPIVFNPDIFKAIYKELPIPKPGDPPPFLVELTLPGNPALTGQPISLLRNGQVIGKALAGDGSVAIAAEFNDGKPLPGELAVAFEADNAAPVQVAGRRRPAGADDADAELPVTANQQTPIRNSATVTMTGTSPARRRARRSPCRSSARVRRPIAGRGTTTRERHDRRQRQLDGLDPDRPDDQGRGWCRRATPARRSTAAARAVRADHRAGPAELGGAAGGWPVRRWVRPGRPAGPAARCRRAGVSSGVG